MSMKNSQSLLAFIYFSMLRKQPAADFGGDG